ncbi:MAG: AarF/ABC1/UbiB kinase family protein [Actinobacteria bacterium]|nr:AarF/ABC1/UbiB kinase family protein [Actinomycetota bacterium]
MEHVGRRLVGAALVGAGVAAAVGAWRRRADRPDDGSISVRSRTQRNLALAGVASRAGSGWAADRARQVFADAERKVELAEARQIRTAEQVAETLGSMKGAMMKLGQMVSYLDQGMPEPVREALAQLQQDAPPMAPELAAQVLAEELGSPPEVLFAEWDPVPIAAASIGQVHRAMTHDGRAVAVKVQYPGVDKAIEGDLDNAGMLFGGMKYLFPGLDPKPLVAELRERITEELDYRIEADNQRLFTEYYRDHPFIHVPDVIGELSTQRVLTSELAAGVRFAEVTAWSDEDRDRVGEIIYRYVFGSLYRLGAFNGDPHPGNYLFGTDGRVTFLDYGLVKRFTDEELLPFEQMIHSAVIEPDPVRFREIVESVGLIKPGLDFTDEQVERYFGHFYEFVRDDEVRTFDHEYASEMVARFFDTSSEHGEIMKAANVPKSMVIIQRINLGLMAILGDLRSTARWRRIAEEIWPWVDAPPATELGRAEAEWRERTGRGTVRLGLRDVSAAGS